MNLKTIRIQQFIKSKSIVDIVTGTILKPIIILGNDNHQYVLRLRQVDMQVQKDYPNCIELLAYEVIKLLKFKITGNQNKKIYPVLIKIDESTIEQFNDIYNHKMIDEEQYLCLKSSMGINLGISFLDGVEQIEPFDCDELANENPYFCYQTAITDNIMMNADRTLNNPNILHDLRTKNWFYAIDFASGLDNCQPVSDIKNTLLNYLKQEPNYLFFKLLEEKNLMAKLSTVYNQIQLPLLTTHKFQNIIPKEWNYEDALLNVITQRLQSIDRIFE